MLADPEDWLSGTTLIAAPHPDDEVLACGGLLARLPRKESLYIVYLTDGARAYTPIIPWADTLPPELPGVREQEARAAASILGVPGANLFFFNFPDGQLARHRQALDDMLIELVRRVKPDHLFIPFRYDRHPDHLAANSVVTSMKRRGDLSGALIEYFVYYRWQLLPTRDVRKWIRPEHMVEIDVTPVAHTKRRALDAFRSQTTTFYEWQDRPILSQTSLEEVCHQSERFLRYDSAFPAASIFNRGGLVIRLLHQLEPVLKKRKDQVLALGRRGGRWYARQTR